MKKILVLFKTHLDVGFTDFAHLVVQKYNENYIPRSIQVAAELAQRSCKEGFTWTTGSWLIYQYLQQADEAKKADLEEAIRKKWVRWHGLPTTMQCEVAGRDLFRYGLSLSKELDERFGVQTIAAKMTDVPGHTRAIVPLLREAGIEFLHLGINPAAAAPDVPDFFRWRSPEGAEITVMYDKGDYGTFSVIPGTQVGVFFAHTGDNKGPSSPEEVEAVFAKLHAEHPEAEVAAADLNDLALAVRPIVKDLPVVTQEIGDTWIHGAGTDPQKLSMYRALLRLAEHCGEEEKKAMYKSLLLVPEHTWGVNEQVWLVDTENYSREHFEAVRHQPNYQKMEQSWQEQRDYVLQAVKDLGDSPVRAQAEAAIGEYRRDLPDFSAMEKVAGNRICLNGWSIAWNEKGALCHLEKNGKVYADQNHVLGTFRYEAFSEDEVNAYMDRYLKPHMRNVEWAYDDNGKRGLQKDMQEHYTCDAVLQEAYTDGKCLYLVLENPEEAKKLYGCPLKMHMKLIPGEKELCFDFAWYDKPANRIPEALWLEFDPVKPLTRIRKLGSDIHPMEVVSCGSREQHATDGMLHFSDITLELVDSPLLAVGKPSIYSFYNKLPDTSKGIWANLFNNMWGTNFPMWNEGDARFRMVLSCKG